jgi:uncharacterized protein (DUF2132 family)
MNKLTEFTMIQKLRAAEEQLNMVEKLLDKVDFNLAQKAQKAA